MGLGTLANIHVQHPLPQNEALTGISCVLLLLLQLLAKIPRLQARITLVVFSYVRRGLVEKDKLIVASLIALRIMRLGDTGGRGATEAFVSPQTTGDAIMYPEEARR